MFDVVMGLISVVVMVATVLWLGWFGVGLIIFSAVGGLLTRAVINYRDEHRKTKRR